MNHASLFSGIGGFDLAAEWMGWNNVFNCEIEEFPRKVLKYHFPNAIQYHDIKRTDFTIHAGTIDILSGGFPCQPFSVEGKRLGKNDERHLWPEMYRAIQEIRPRYIVGENVRGLLSWNDGLVLDEVYTDLENEGYEVLTFVLPAAGINAPHKRERVWIIAHDTQDTMRSGLLQRKSLQEGTEIWQQRDTGSGNTDWIHREERTNATNTKNSGRGGSSGEECTDERNRILQGEQEWGQMGSETQGCSGKWVAPNTNNSGARESMRLDKQWSQDDQGWQGQSQSESWQEGGIRNAPNTNSSGSQERHISTKSGKQGHNNRRCDEAGETWQKFPTQSPVRSGDDGLPTELDNLTFPKWRRESIKAYGNAIVPQIAYRIFQSINLTDHE